MKLAVCYSSATGNTKMLAEAIAKALHCETSLFEAKKQPDLSGYDLIFAGFWTDKGTCDAAAQQLLQQCSGKTVALFGTAGFGREEQYFADILNRVKSRLPADVQCLGGFLCQGKMPAAVRKRYEAMLEQNPEDAKAAMLLENFDLALTHPDHADLQKAAVWAEQMVQQMQN